MVRFVQLAIFVYAVCVAVCVGSQVAAWSSATFTEANARLTAALH
jgi:hypothetical protein